MHASDFIVELPDQILYWQADIKTPMDGRRGYKTVVLLEWEHFIYCSTQRLGKKQEKENTGGDCCFFPGEKATLIKS